MRKAQAGPQDAAEQPLDILLVPPKRLRPEVSVVEMDEEVCRTQWGIKKRCKTTEWRLRARNIDRFFSRDEVPGVLYALKKLGIAGACSSSR